MIEVVAGGDFAARAVDMKKDGGYGIVIGRLTDLEDEVVDHAGSDISWNFLGDDSEEIDLGDTFFLGLIPLDKLFFKRWSRVDVGGSGEKLVVSGQEEEIGEEAASEQNQAHDDQEFRGAGHASEKDATERAQGQGCLGNGFPGGGGGRAEAGESGGGGFGGCGQCGSGRSALEVGGPTSDLAF